MKTVIRIKGMKEVYDELCDTIKNDESLIGKPPEDVENGIILIKNMERALLENLLDGNSVGAEDLKRSVSSMDKSELIEIVEKIMSDPICRYTILRIR